MTILNYFKALSDETRLRLVNLLTDHELNVNEITSLFGMGQSRISRHLKVLADSGLIRSRRDGLWVFYSAVDSGPAMEFLRALVPVMRSDSGICAEMERFSRMISIRSEEKAEYFDSIAPEWIGVRESILGGLNTAEIIAPVIGTPVMLADLGCGNGDLLEALAPGCGAVIGIDRSPRMLEQAAAKFSRAGLRAEFRPGEIERLPMKNSECDAAVINMVLHHLHAPESALNEASRVLAPGGILVIIDLVRHNNELMRERFRHRRLGFSEDEISAWLERAGFISEKRELFDVNYGLRAFMAVCRKSA
jgi:ArsR family transcriptional regulator